MRIEVLCFASARDAVGTPRVRLDVHPGSTVEAAVESLAALHPALRALLGKMRYAVNEEFVAAARPLADGDTLALIPPTSGG